MRYGQLLRGRIVGASARRAVRRRKHPDHCVANSACGAPESARESVASQACPLFLHPLAITAALPLFCHVGVGRRAQAPAAAAEDPLVPAERLEDPARAAVPPAARPPDSYLCHACTPSRHDEPPGDAKLRSTARARPPSRQDEPPHHCRDTPASPGGLGERSLWHRVREVEDAACARTTALLARHFGRRSHSRTFSSTGAGRGVDRVHAVPLSGGGSRSTTSPDAPPGFSRKARLVLGAASAYASDRGTAARRPSKGGCS